MLKKSLKLLAAFAFTASTITANAGVIIDVTEVGADVVFTSTGSLDLTGATSLGGVGYQDGFIAAGNNFYIASGAGSSVDQYALSFFDGDFGTSSAFLNPNSTSGNDFFIWGSSGSNQSVGVQVGYTSGSAINSGMVFNGATIASLNLTPGTYNYGIPSDTITLNIGTGGGVVPVPATLALFGLGLVGLGWSRRKKV